MKIQIISLTLSLIVASLIITGWITSPFSLQYYFDTMFVLSLLLTMTGASMYLFQSRLFHPFIQHFQYFFRKTNRAAQIANQLERKHTHTHMPPVLLPPLAGLFTVTGVILTITTSFISIILY